MIEGCFFNAQLKSHQYNDHSVTAANSSRHTIVCHRNKLHWPEKDKCVRYLAVNWPLTKLTDSYADHRLCFFLLCVQVCDKADIFCYTLAFYITGWCCTSVCFSEEGHYDSFTRWFKSHSPVDSHFTQLVSTPFLLHCTCRF